MHHLERRQDGVVHVLEEERLAVETVHAHAVGDFDDIDLCLFRQDVIEVRLQAWVGFEDFGADCALGAGFYFGFGAWCESAIESWVLC